MAWYYIVGDVCVEGYCVEHKEEKGNLVIVTYRVMMYNSE
jgi:hypothetical protein